MSLGAVADRLLRGQRRAGPSYSAVPQDDEDGDDLEEIDDLPASPGQQRQHGGDAEAEYWSLQRAGGCSTYFNLCNTSLGIGILSFSLAFAIGGALNTTLFLLVAGAASCANSLAIVDSCAHYRQVSLQGLVRVALGQRMEVAVSAMMVVYCFGTCAGYLDVIGEYAAEVLHEWSSVPDEEPECAFPSEWWCSVSAAAPLAFPSEVSNKRLRSGCSCCRR